MIDALNFLRGNSLDTLSIIVRLVLAVICGGIIGIIASSITSKKEEK